MLTLLWKSSKSAWAPFHKKTSTLLLTLIFREFTSNFDVRCVSRKFMSPLIQKMITDAVYFISGVWEGAPPWICLCKIVIRCYKKNFFWSSILLNKLEQRGIPQNLLDKCSHLFIFVSLQLDIKQWTKTCLKLQST